jgi:hypothetical protein
MIYLGSSRKMVADPNHLYEDPDPASHFNADPDPAVHFKADPDPVAEFIDPDWGDKVNSGI